MYALFNLYFIVLNKQMWGQYCYNMCLNVKKKAPKIPKLENLRQFEPDLSKKKNKHKFKDKKHKSELRTHVHLSEI